MTRLNSICLTWQNRMLSKILLMACLDWSRTKLKSFLKEKEKPRRHNIYRIAKQYFPDELSNVRLFQTLKTKMLENGAIIMCVK